MALSVWLECLHQTAHGNGAALLAALKQAQLNMCDQQHAAFGIVLFERPDSALLDMLRTACCSATVLAIAVRPLGAGEIRAVLGAGAADLLSWRPAPLCAEQVLARLRRWSTVQELVDSSSVRRCLVGDSPAWRALVRGVVEVAAFTQASVLITGETGTGKDLIAQLIHRLSACKGELTVLDCTTLSQELAGSELFGHERGAFTGAAGARDGAFALADGGVLFLDEVGELPLTMQAQLLRAIQERKYKRVGGNSWQPTQFRLVCATNRDLETQVANGAFRADLYYRIAGWRCRPPPLRERPQDILPLVMHFLAELSAQAGQPELDPAVREYLLTRDYPGNVRDLRQTVCRIWHRHCGPGPITIGDVPPDERLAAGQAAWPDQYFEAAIRHALELGISMSRISRGAADVAIRLVLEQEGQNNQRAAQRLGVTDRALQIRRKTRAEACKDG
ncbi:sigma 54-interacting transcriptional regulator [Janthinobacterium agaricidamnosum]|uniref:Sigma-54 interaction domain protein n=1 Tax=Janthinobacterium agaricidamnosum NBRC 102515 = DSM 9628 TaxID=1349767 RepID=W0V1Z6_9BURK|nr:sigma 54-interacting transcriptional regulator [Janthinobacterium agaricidamnosum]CDG82849.1 sigma-54 interaction domain protein [Janthinobacterium agaricidamnosum NBRC 102515 = DSM 9628]